MDANCAADGEQHAVETRTTLEYAAKGALLALAFVYAFVLPILGLQDMAACNMFANLHGPTAGVSGMNHWLVPTGLLQQPFSCPSLRWYFKSSCVTFRRTHARLHPVI